MASERDFELLDDYIGNRLSKTDREAFESHLKADPELHRELKLQQGIVESLKKARVSELKAMLNNIPPSTIPTHTSAVAKWAGMAIAVVIAVGLFFYLKPEQAVDVPPATDSVSITPPAMSTTEQEVVTEPSHAESTQEVTPSVAAKPETHKSARITKRPLTEPSTEAKTPEINVFDPDVEGSTEQNAGNDIAKDNAGAQKAIQSDITSEIVSNDRKHTFHYQLREDKLILYGAFDKNLYEILEFISDRKRTIFLSYKNNFYLLNQAGEKVKPLSPVNDPVLIQKLKEYQRQ